MTQNQNNFTLLNNCLRQKSINNNFLEAQQVNPEYTNVKAGYAVTNTLDNSVRITKKLAIRFE